MSAILRAFLLICLSCASSLAQDQQTPTSRVPEIHVELNKLEPAGNACRTYFIVTNGLAEPLKELRLDVFLFDKSGIILRRFGLTFMEARAERSKVVLFDLPDLACDALGRLVINDVVSCLSALGTPVHDCLARLRTSTRTPALFTY
jgi:hypothetical protein